MKNKTVLHKSQLNSQIIADLKGFLEKKETNHCTNEVVKFFVTHSQKHQYIFPSHKTISKAIKYSISYIKKSIDYLVDNGVITKKQRGLNQSNIYRLNEYFYQPEVIRQLKIYFRITFAVASLFNFSDSYTKEWLLIITKDVNLFKVTGCFVSDNLKRNNNKHLMYFHENPWQQMWGDCDGPPNIKKSEVEFDALFSISKKEIPMQAFTQEQLEQLKDYSKETIDYAHKILMRDMLAGKAISFPFQYFKGICDAHNKNPQTGNPTAFKQNVTTTPLKRPKTGPLSLYKEPEQIVQETDFEFAYNVEKGLHHRLLNEPDFHPAAGKIPNPKLHLLSPEEQIVAMSVHKECSCRAELDPSSLGAQLLAKIGLTVV